MLNDKITALMVAGYTFGSEMASAGANMDMESDASQEQVIDMADGSKRVIKTKLKMQVIVERIEEGHSK